MKLTHSVRYDAPPAAVYAMLTDRAFRARAVSGLGATSQEVEVDGGSVRLDWEQSNTDIPAFARKIVGERIRTVQEEEWTGGETATFSLTIPGKPGAITGTRRLVADGDGTLDTFAGEASARIPLVGAKLERLIGDKLVDGWNNEHGLGQAWLKGER